jgi:putative CocE/NonD family hydrolase
MIVGEGYIRVVQDVRGKYGSEGGYVMNRPLCGPLNHSGVDHATDTWDTIDWLVKHVSESNGRVGLIGISYNGFLTLMGLVNPHPALKVAVPMNAMVDGWMGDDWFHNGAFRQQNMSYMYQQVATVGSDAMWWTSHYDDYDMFMQAVSAGELGRRRGMEQIGFWRKLLEHPDYDAFWQNQAMDKILAGQPVKVPVMLVHSLWDAEDIYGTIAVYEAIEPKDKENDKVFLVMGPWSHGQGIGEGSSLGALKFHSDTSLYFRQHILKPFLNQYLKDASPSGVSPVTAFETGRNRWQHLSSWPASEGGDSKVRKRVLYFKENLKLDFSEPQSGSQLYDEFVSDPSKPVPFRARPIQPTGYEGRLTWPRWLVDDQREASGRPDVLVFCSEVLHEPVHICGRPLVNLTASTSGTDSDWVVKLIDVYPDQVASQPEMGGYQLMVSADIFRGRYRTSFEKPEPLKPDHPLIYRFAIPTANHVFLPGHRIMVQIQCSWFPLYDRNPQTYVPNIFMAEPKDYRKATQRVYHSPEHSSFIELPVFGE